jgi:NADPH:quinone reductase-like Zn-dependent oxidoreductase
VLIWPLLTTIKYFGIVQFFEFLIEKLSSPSPSQPGKAMDTSGIILVAGATGGVGRRVVDILRKKGFPVRVLVFLLFPS